MPTTSTVVPPSACPSAHSSNWRAALLSSVVPGLGHASHGVLWRAAFIVFATGSLVGAAWWLGRASGIGPAIFFAMLIILPWWAIQAYDAFLLHTTSPPPPWRRTLSIIWERAHDIRYLGALFLLTAFTDFYIIVANPDYALTVFCQRPGGLLGVLVKAQSPTLHTLIGYGFLRLRRWSLFLYFAYAAFGLLNATVNYACFGYGRVRMVFVLSLALFTAYVFWRRDRFLTGPALEPSL